MRCFPRIILAAVFAAIPSMAVADDWPRLVRVTTRVVEVPPATMGDWLADPELGGHELHAKAVELIFAGGARIIDTGVITTRSNSRGLLVSVRELIHPTEYEPPILPVPYTWPPTPRVSTFAFETMPLGFMQEIEVAVEGDVTLRIEHEMSGQSDSVVWNTYADRWGDASVGFPLRDTKRIRTQATLVPGRFHLLGVHTHLPAALPETQRKWMVFVKADILVQKSAGEGAVVPPQTPAKAGGS